MVNCPKCGAAVREGKAFCHNCGSPMNAAMRRREEPQPDFGATIPEPPPRRAPTPSASAPITEIQPAGTETAPANFAPQPAAQVAFPTPSAAPPDGKRRTSRKIGCGFVLLLLFLTFVVFVIAISLD